MEEEEEKMENVQEDGEFLNIQNDLKNLLVLPMHEQVVHCIKLAQNNLSKTDPRAA